MSPQKEQGVFPFVDTIEYVQDLRTGEDSLRRKKIRLRQTPTLEQRNRALTDWLSETDFENKFQFGAEAWRTSESVQSAELSGQMVEYFSGRGAGDDAEFYLREALDIARTRFRPIRVLDIAKVIRKQSILVDDKLRLRGRWIHSYSDWVINLMGDTRNLSQDTVDNLKKYVHQGLLIEVS